MTRALLLFLLLLFALSGLKAQLSADQRSDQAIQAISDLKKGVLIVRLESDLKKIEALADLAAKPGNSPEQARRIEQMRKDLIEEKRQLNTWWMQAFLEEFDFTDVLFVYDTTSRATLVDQDGKNSFLDRELAIDPARRLNERPFVMARFGTTDRDRGAGVEAMILRNSDFEDLHKPFPYYIKETRFSYIFSKLFGSKTAERDNIFKMVRKLDEQLKKFWAGMDKA